MTLMTIDQQMNNLISLHLSKFESSMSLKMQIIVDFAHLPQYLSKSQVRKVLGIGNERIKRMEVKSMLLDVSDSDAPKYLKSEVMKLSTSDFWRDRK